MKLNKANDTIQDKSPLANLQSRLTVRQAEALRVAAEYLGDSAELGFVGDGIRLKQMDASHVSMIDISINTDPIAIPSQFYKIDLNVLSRVLLFCPRSTIQLSRNCDEVYVGLSNGNIRIPVDKVTERDPNNDKKPTVEYAECLTLESLPIQLLKETSAHYLKFQGDGENLVVQSESITSTQEERMTSARLILCPTKNRFEVHVGFEWLSPLIFYNGPLDAYFASNMPVMFHGQHVRLDMKVWMAPRLV